jgi:hypothetical protein
MADDSGRAYHITITGRDTGMKVANMIRILQQLDPEDTIFCVWFEKQYSEQRMGDTFTEEEWEDIVLSAEGDIYDEDHIFEQLGLENICYNTIEGRD